MAAVVGTCLLGITLIGGWAGVQLQPVSSDVTKKRIVIPSKTSASGVSQILEDAGIIRSARAFHLYSRLTSGTAGFKAGLYRISPSMTAGEVAALLRRGGAQQLPMRSWTG